MTSLGKRNTSSASTEWAGSLSAPLFCCFHSFISVLGIMPEFCRGK